MNSAFRKRLKSLFCNRAANVAPAMCGRMRFLSEIASHRPLSDLWAPSSRSRRASQQSATTQPSIATSPTGDTNNKMAEAVSVRFQEMSEEVAFRMEQVLEAYAAEHGRVFDNAAFGQTGVDLKTIARDAISIGMDIWPTGCTEASEEEAAGNVVRFPMVRRMVPSGRVVKAALSTVGAMAGSTILAAATTDVVDLPGFHHVAEYVYSKNTPPTETRIVDWNGKLYEVTFERRPGEQWDMVHVGHRRVVRPEELATTPAGAVTMSASNG